MGTTCGLKPLDEEQDLLLDCHHDPITSGVDVLVATPGRLVDHLRATPHFDLRNLRFLVVDEADRLLDQQFHGWLPAVLEATRHSCCNPPIASPWLTSSLPLVLPFLFLPVPPPFPQSHPGSPTAVPLSSSAITTPRQPLQKLLFSASLSLDPEQLSLLSLHQPKLFSVAPVKGEMLGQSTIPTTLIEYAVLCSAELRPLALLHLLVSRGHARSLCFTHSRDTTHRLALLLQQFPKHVLVAELSSDTSPSRRRRAVEDFTSGKIQVRHTSFYSYTRSSHLTCPSHHRYWFVRMQWHEAWTCRGWSASSITNLLSDFAPTSIEWVVLPELALKALRILCWPRKRLGRPHSYLKSRVRCDGLWNNLIVALNIM